MTESPDISTPPCIFFETFCIFTQNKHFHVIFAFFQELDMSVGNFTSVLSGVDRRVQVMRQFQQLSRGLESRDYNLLISNMNYVSKWSLIQMVVVIISGIVQVYFVKKLFQDPRQGTGKSKARI